MYMKNTKATGVSTAGCGIAMGNACDEVKKCSEKITDTIHQEGIVISIESM